MSPIHYNLSIIVAIAQNGAIGKDNNLLWHISDDLKRFRALTSGHSVVMGRRTFDSLPKKPLPNRRNIVLTHNHDFASSDVEVAFSVGQVLKMALSDDETFIIGGATLYQQFLPFANHLYVTWVYRDFDADAFFPPIDLSLFRQSSISPVVTDPISGLPFAYADYYRLPLR